MVSSFLSLDRFQELKIQPGQCLQYFKGQDSYRKFCHAATFWKVVPLYVCLHCSSSPRPPEYPPVPFLALKTGHQLLVQSLFLVWAEPYLPRPQGTLEAEEGEWMRGESPCTPEPHRTPRVPHPCLLTDSPPHPQGQALGQ